ncbi:hypothetical protein QTO34_000685 [Cnephaeus nilssonii]|uniref:CSD domain-containing protein n=1 Tax=Cnephaeus nilssonii TaxID=3371016 RepID=A0AA40IC28_CNENI|nr:hypothetical protein QTO34_000685 [Eptesicus nilssonii]
MMPYPGPQPPPPPLSLLANPRRFLEKAWREEGGPPTRLRGKAGSGLEKESCCEAHSVTSPTFLRHFELWREISVLRILLKLAPVTISAILSSEAHTQLLPPRASTLGAADTKSCTTGSPGGLTLAEPASGDKKVIATKVFGTVKWFSVRNGYGFINRNEIKEDVFVHQFAIRKNNPRKYLVSVRPWSANCGSQATCGFLAP